MNGPLACVLGIRGLQIVCPSKFTLFTFLFVTSLAGDLTNVLLNWKARILSQFDVALSLTVVTSSNASFAGVLPMRRTWM